VGNGSGVSRGDRNRNARLARLRVLVPAANAIVGIDLADRKQMVVVTDHDSKVLARKTFRCRAWDLGAAFQFKPAKSPVGFQIDGAYLQNKFDESVTLTSGKAEWWFGTGDIVFWFPVAAETRVRPYILGGGGVYNYKIKPSGTSSSTSETKFGINVGAGFDFDFQSNVGIFLEGRFHNVFIQGSDAKFIPVNVGIRFHTK